MKPLFSLTTALFSLFFFCVCHVSAQEKPRPERVSGTATVFKTPEGVNILKIAYPCDIHKDISLEVRILDDVTQKTPAMTIPLYFNDSILREKDARGITFSDVIFASMMESRSGSVILDQNADDPGVTQMTYGDVKIGIAGRQSAMGPRQVSVRCVKKNTRTGNEEVTVVFPFLSASKMGNRPAKTTPREEESFLYDLADKDFLKPQKLLVWLLSGEKILMKTEVDWPGR